MRPRGLSWGVHIRSSEVGEHLGTVSAAAATADIWFAWVGGHAHDVDRFSRDYLSADEIAHLGGYRIREAAERYVVTRSLVRTILSARLGIRARDIRVSRTDTGKPIVTEGVHFNVSHSGDLIVLALCDHRPVGVDIERRRDVAKVQALSDRWLTEAERQEFKGLRDLGAGDSDAFLRIWSLKEARIKAVGVGISGASSLRLDAIEAVPLDRLLDTPGAQRNNQRYVGAIAFA